MNKKIIANSSRQISLTAGIMYLLTFISIPTLALYGPIHDPHYITSTGSDTSVLIGCVLEMVVALTGIGTAVALYPMIRRQHEGTALGFVATRTLEAASIFVGIGSFLTIVTLHQSGVGAAGLTMSQMLIALYDRMFILGQNLMPAMNALLLGSLLYRSRLVPRVLPTLGLIGAPLLIIGQGAVLFGLIGRISTLALITALPIALWELSLGLWLVAKGFDSAAVARLETLHHDSSF